LPFLCSACSARQVVNIINAATELFVSSPTRQGKDTFLHPIKLNKYSLCESSRSKALKECFHYFLPEGRLAIFNFDSKPGQLINFSHHKPQLHKVQKIYGPKKMISLAKGRSLVIKKVAE